MPRVSFLLASALALLLPHLQRYTTAKAQSVTVSVPVSKPSNAAPLDQGLISFSIEQDRWVDWAGKNEPNGFFLNTLENLRERQGGTPWIRIGANSEDHTDFSFDVQFSETIFPTPSASMPYPEATNITVGQKYYNLASHLPRGTHVIWGVNLGSDNITAAFLEARAIKTAFESGEVKGKGVVLEGVEIGNEADLYGGNGHRNPANWTVAEYVKEWTTFAKNVSVAAGVSQNGPKFFGLAFSHNAHSGTAFSFENAVKDGLLDSREGKLINEISQHMYFGSGVAGVANLPTLMSKTLIRGNVSSLKQDVADVHAKGLGYVLGETNSYFSHGAPGVSNAAGAAIWLTDYTLLAASLGVKRMHFHEGVGFRYNLIQPVTLTRSIIDASPISPLPPHIQPTYYGALIAAEAVGTSGSSSVVELNINDNTLSGYAVFEKGKVERVVLIDSDAFLKGDKVRGGRNVTLSFSAGSVSGLVDGKSGGSVSVKRLNIGHADDTKGLTWAGQSFETSDAKPSGAVKKETIKVVQSGGTVKVNVGIQATEIVLLSF
ncbi:uncharacterized protein FOMMEDRAFT_22402 [Fomitiporia mediterranea MF3/22]|uniref:uncharacterized protein n=1 Tax=Fomitiporia mediterranea (strain MF3/22) TaxID=694068 RepID=UPI0004407D5D|nr:uncharacterized protein FOMMEDRAFT_22402 [Fomitiporia mediterranea MF3/22]EJD00646.1 hypothetical protein FOMMEDRAFT_22402 [Fomitiporia mediterranea MF3/22]